MIGFAKAPYSHLASQYEELSLTDLALKTYDSALYYFKEADYLIGLYGVYFNKSIVYVKQKKYDLALTFGLKAYDGFNEIKVREGQIVTLLGLADIYKLTHQNDEALQYARKVLRMLGRHEYINRRVQLYMIMAESYSALEEPDSALYYAESGIHLADSIQLLALKERGLGIKAKIMERQSDSIAALQLYRRSSILEDSLERLQNIPQSVAVILNEQTDHYEKEMSWFQQLLAEQKRWLLISIAMTIAVGLIGFLFIGMNKRESLILHKQKNQLVNLLQTQKSQNENARRSLVVKDASLAVKDELLADIGELLEKIKADNEPAKLNKYVSDIQKLIKHDGQLSKKWEGFFLHFENVHPDFIERLKSQYHLTSKELKLCAFIKMNLSNKEIGFLLNVQLNTVHVSMSRLKKRLKVPQEKTVYDFIHDR